MSDQLERKNLPSGLIVTLWLPAAWVSRSIGPPRLDAVEVRRHRVVAGAGEVDPAVLGIDVLERRELPRGPR